MLTPLVPPSLPFLWPTRAILLGRTLRPWTMFWGVFARTPLSLLIPQPTHLPSLPPSWLMLVISPGTLQPQIMLWGVSVRTLLHLLIHSQLCRRGLQKDQPPTHQSTLPRRPPATQRSPLTLSFTWQTTLYPSPM